MFTKLKLLALIVYFLSESRLFSCFLLFLLQDCFKKLYNCFQINAGELGLDHEEMGRRDASHLFCWWHSNTSEWLIELHFHYFFHNKFETRLETLAYFTIVSCRILDKFLYEAQTPRESCPFFIQTLHFLFKFCSLEMADEVETFFKNHRVHLWTWIWSKAWNLSESKQDGLNILSKSWISLKSWSRISPTNSHLFLEVILPFVSKTTCEDVKLNK